MKFSRYDEAELIGKRYGKLTILRYSEKKGNRGKSYVWCKCDCGNEKEVQLSNLRHGGVKSCGCLKHEATAKHHKSNTRLYAVYMTMKQRCCNENHRDYKYYGSRGIQVCDEWKGNFAAFYDWSLENGYDETADRGQYTIDRIDVNGNYEPSNCRWITIEEQQRNKRNNVLYEYKGSMLTLTEISKQSGIPAGTLTSRIYESGMSIEKATKEDKMKTGREPKKYSFNGKTQNLSEWAKEIGIPRTTLEYRLKSGRPYEKVFTNEKNIHILRGKEADV